MLEISYQIPIHTIMTNHEIGSKGHIFFLQNYTSPYIHCKLHLHEIVKNLITITVGCFRAKISPSGFILLFKDNR